jgi:hypothetical protein
MKKLLATAVLLLAVSAPAMADKFIIERGWADDLKANAANSSTWYFKGVRDFTENFAMDSSLQLNQVDAAAPNNKISGRIDIGAIPKFDIYGPVKGYTRFAYGEKFSTSGNFDYYSIEPGIRSTLGGGFSGQIAWRFRTPFNTANNDTTRTWRTGVTYDITPKDTIGVRLDNQRGDSNQNIWNLNYSRSF